ncbi:MAG: hypothetical protein ABIE03_07830 [Patescibacteria group bacterium]|nr:hypothetical protein [Patescibacteria group bacterium]
MFKKWTEILGVDENVVGSGDSDPSVFPRLVKTALLVAIALLAVGLVVVIFYGGFTWITAGDSDEKLQKAQKIMKDGIMAILIAFGFILVFAIIAGLLGVDITDFSFIDEVFS